MEYLILTGFMMLILSILLVASYLKIGQSQKHLDIDSAEKAVNEIKRAADSVYVEGHPTKLTVSVYLPKDMDPAHSFIGNKTINIAMSIGDSHTDVWRSTRGEIGWDLYGSSQMPTTEGYYTLIVESTPYDLFGGKITVHE